VDELAWRKLLGLVGLGVRGRLAVVGVQQVRDAAMRDKLAFAIVAPDASRHSRDKVVPLLTARRVRFIEGPSAAVLGGAVGKESTAVVGIVDRQLAKGIFEIVEAGAAATREERSEGAHRRMV
jgi:ribosomal protein L7Ae-like RNA K-turn-binding protein